MEKIKGETSENKNLINYHIAHWHPSLRSQKLDLLGKQTSCKVVREILERNGVNAYHGMRLFEDATV